MPRNRKSSSKSSTPQPSASSTAFEISEEEQWRLINATGILGGAGGKRPSEVRAEQAAAANVKNKSQPRPKIEELPEGYDSNEEYEQPGQEDDEDEDDEEVTWEEVPSEEKDGPLDLADEIFESVLLIVPLCFLFALMDILCRMQYAEHPTFFEEVKRTVSMIPIISLLVFYTNRYKDRPIAQAGFFVTAIACGLRLVWIVNHSGFLKVIRQSPPLSVIWVYMIIQLNLTPAVISLLILWGLVKFLKLKIIMN